MKKAIYFIILTALSSYLISCNKDGTSNETTVSDIDGNIYHTVTIGTQVWMVENLKTTKFRDGESIPNVNDNINWASTKNAARCDYANYEYNGEKYGHLYNWYAINDNKNIAPQGWHIPSDGEWKQLEMTLGMTQIDADKIGLFRGTDQAVQIKAPSSSWSGGGLSTNTSGFSAIPTERRKEDGTFITGGHCYWWTSSEYSSIYAWGRHVDNNSTIERNKFSKNAGFSVRCIKDY